MQSTAICNSRANTLDDQLTFDIDIPFDAQLTKDAKHAFPKRRQRLFERQHLPGRRRRGSGLRRRWRQFGQNGADVLSGGRLGQHHDVVVDRRRSLEKKHDFRDDLQLVRWRRARRERLRKASEQRKGGISKFRGE